jgi:hypothetical protein
MSLIARLLDKRNKMVIPKLAQEAEKHLNGTEKDDEATFDKGAYTNGIQDL